jgi:transmembrane sensor
MDEEQVRALLKKYNSGECTEKEIALIEKSFFEFNEQDIEISFKKLKSLKKQTFRKLSKTDIGVNNLKVWISISAAAAAIAIALYIFLPHFDNNEQASLKMAEKILPVGNVAQITLSNGKIIQLDNTRDEIKINDSSLTYTDGFKIDITNSNTEQTISTPRGGEYKIVLSDGTKVWLNAATVLQYPTSFRERAERKVKLLSGEAYFEVARDKRHPFIVATLNQNLTVLGTHFNINAYTKSVKTTLLEGSVKINFTNKTDSIKLQPGEQSSTSGNKFIKTDADLDIETAWKNGKMKFKDANLQSILSEAERWYNIDIRYNGKISEKHLTGGISRKSSLATLLKLLQMSGVNFSMREESGKNVLSIESYN